MKAITLSQPWAELVAAGRKRYETRSWRTNYRGPLAIHAARLGSGGLSTEKFEEMRKDFGLGELFHWSAIIAVVDLVACERTEDVRDWISGYEFRAGDFASGRYAWRLENVRRLDPVVPASGKLGLWTPSESQFAAVSV